MSSIKKMVLGIGLIQFGFYCLYLAIQANWPLLELAGLLLPAAGLAILIAGFFQKAE